MIYERFRAVARSHPARAAIIDEGVTLAYGDAVGRVDTLAAALARDAGVHEGDLVVALVPNSADAVALYLAAAKLGAVLMPIDPALRNRELRTYFERFDIRAAVTSTSFQVERPDALAGLVEGRRFTVDALARSTGESFGVRRVGPFEGVLAALSTSGSTGAPKIVGRTHRGLLAGFAALAGAIGSAARDSVLCVTPFHHAHGLANGMIYALMSGGTLVVMRRFLPRRLVEVVSEHGVSVLVASPFIFGTVAECVSDRSAFATVRTAISSGEAVPGPAARAFLEKTGVKICELYGSSETGIMTLDGCPVEGVEIKIVHEHGAASEPGAIGEVFVRSDWMAAGYLGAGGEWRLPLRDGFYATGDLGHVDAHGTLVLDGRTSRRLNIAGVKVDPVEIERVILSHPEVADAAVSGVTGERGMALIKACVVVRQGHALGREALIEHCRKELAEFKVPRIVELVDSIDVNIMGKRIGEVK